MNTVMKGLPFWGSVSKARLPACPQGLETRCPTLGLDWWGSSDPGELHMDLCLVTHSCSGFLPSTSS